MAARGTRDISEEKMKAACALPVSRVKTIMKSSPDVENISHDAIFLITKATELFVKALTKQVYESYGKSAQSLEYSDLANTVNKDDNLQFLQEIIPRKVKAREVLVTQKK